MTWQMPQYQVPEMHAIFTDHNIAIQRERSLSIRMGELQPRRVAVGQLKRCHAGV
jgi:hypothetical protein